MPRESVRAERRCTGCGKVKLSGEFYAKRGRTKSGELVYYRASRCKPCVRLSMREGYAGLPESERESARAASRVRSQVRYRRTKRELDLILHYGITLGQYEMMSAAQGGVCAICREKPDGKVLAVDHDHATGDVRGLLCSQCNLALGGFRDSESLLGRAIEYLRASRSAGRRQEIHAPERRDPREPADRLGGAALLAGQ